MRKAVIKAKEEWIKKVASDAEAAVKDGRVRWNCIHRLQRVYGGRRPVRPTAVFKEDGQLTRGPSEVLDRWFQHFKKVLKFGYDPNVLDALSVSPPLLHLDAPPPVLGEQEDVNTYVQVEVKEGRALSGILPN